MVRGSGDQVVQWSGGQVVRGSGGQVVRFFFGFFNTSLSKLVPDFVSLGFFA